MNKILNNIAGADMSPPPCLTSAYPSLFHNIRIEFTKYAIQIEDGLQGCQPL